MGPAVGPAVEAPSTVVPARFTAYGLASRYLGMGELPGGQDNPEIRAWLMAVGVSYNDAHDEVPWCAAFAWRIAWLLDLPRPTHRPAAARSWLTVGIPVAHLDAKIGFDIVILARGLGPQPGPEVLIGPGHVGFFAGRASRVDGSPGVLLLGGNQGDRVTIASFGAERVLGVRRLA